MLGRLALVVRAYAPDIRRHWIYMILTVATFATGMILEGIRPFIIGWFADSLGEKNIVHARESYYTFCIFQCSIFFAWRFFDFSIVLFQAKVMRRLDMRSFAVLQRMSMRFYENSFAGSLVKQCNRFRNSFEVLCDVSIFQILKVILTVLVALFSFFQRDLVFGLFLSVWTVLFVVVSFVISYFKGPLDEKAANADTGVSGALADSLSNRMTVLSYGREEEEQQRFHEVVEAAYRARRNSWLASSTGDVFIGIFSAVLQIWIVGAAFDGLVDGTVSVGDFIFYQTYVILILNNLWDFSKALRRISEYTAEAKDMADYNFTKPEIEDAPDAKPLVVTSGRIEYRDVQFSYADNGKKEVDLDLRIASGESIAFVGPSGAGKTTLVKLLQRMYEPKRGRILIDGQDISAVTQKSLRQKIAFVMQDPNLFHRTLRENIAFSRPDATEEMIIDAAKKAHAWEFIQGMQDGLDTVVGERGVKLSGGQRQRITLARAFLADAPILILDEATNALDSVTESLVQDAIKTLLHEGRTCIVIAHRLSTIMEADRIIVMKEGRIEEEGTHRELLEREKGLYQTLWTHQSGGYIGEE